MAYYILTEIDTGIAGDTFKEGMITAAASFLILDNEVHNARDGEASLNAKLVAIEAVIASGSGVLVSSDDTTVAYLDGKLLAGEAIDFTVGSPAGNETLTLDCEDASTSNKGVLETATDAEALAMSETVKALVPSNLAALTASVTATGISELATSNETVTGTDTGRTTTPAGVKAALDDRTKDEDDMSSNSDAHWPTQQSTKAFTSSGIVAKTGAYSVLAADCIGHRTFTNDGASIEVIFTLPTGVAGYKSSYIVTDAYYLQVKASNSEKLRYLGTQTGANGYVRASVVGNTLTAIWSGDDWVITEMRGSWLYDQ